MIKVFKEKIPHISLSSCTTLYIEVINQDPSPNY
jgi:hypothetical protein